MDSKTLLNKIFTLLSIDAKEVELTRNVVYGSLLPDNDILEVSEWKIGVPVFIISEDGNKKPLKDGEYDIVIEDTADGLSQGGPTKYALKIDGNKIESLQIKQLKETKAISNKTQLEKTETIHSAEYAILSRFKFFFVVIKFVVSRFNSFWSTS